MSFRNPDGRLLDDGKPGRDRTVFRSRPRQYYERSKMLRVTKPEEFVQYSNSVQKELSLVLSQFLSTFVKNCIYAPEILKRNDSNGKMNPQGRI